MAATTSRVDATLDELSGRAADAALRGAIELLVPIGTRPGWDHDAIESLLVEVRAELREALPAALDDARRAFDCGMGAIASATFLASMTLAGTTAAKRWRKGRAA